MNTPVLLLVWIRPNETSKVIDSLRVVKPSQIFVSCDGPRINNIDDEKLINLTKSVIKDCIDWNCSIKYRYSNINQGLKISVESAINWFFENVEHGIILEDDCVPHVSFYQFCSLLLERYRLDSRIFAISGSNFQNGVRRGPHSYYFSKYSHCWGWATWRRSWRLYDSKLTNISESSINNFSQNFFDTSAERRFWMNLFFNVKLKNIPNSWAIRWQYTCLVNNALIVIPNVNLTHNIGNDQSASNTKNDVFPKAVRSLRIASKPSFIVRDKHADRFTFINHYNGKMYYQPYFAIFVVLRMIYRFLKNFKS